MGTGSKQPAPASGILHGFRDPPELQGSSTASGILHGPRDPPDPQGLGLPDRWESRGSTPPEVRDPPGAGETTERREREGAGRGKKGHGSSLWVSRGRRDTPPEPPAPRGTLGAPAGRSAEERDRDTPRLCRSQSGSAGSWSGAKPSRSPESKRSKAPLSHRDRTSRSCGDSGTKPAGLRPSAPGSFPREHPRCRSRLAPSRPSIAPLQPGAPPVPTAPPSPGTPPPPQL